MVDLIKKLNLVLLVSISGMLSAQAGHSVDQVHRDIAEALKIVKAEVVETKVQKKQVVKSEQNQTSMNQEKNGETTEAKSTLDKASEIHRRSERGAIF